MHIYTYVCTYTKGPDNYLYLIAILPFYLFYFIVGTPCIRIRVAYFVYFIIYIYIIFFFNSIKLTYIYRGDIQNPLANLQTTSEG